MRTCTIQRNWIRTLSQQIFPCALLIGALLPTHSGGATVQLNRSRPSGKLSEVIDEAADRIRVFHVTEADTGEAIPDLRYRFSNSFGNPVTGWRRPGKDGSVTAHDDPSSNIRRIEFDAEGYKSLLLDLFHQHESEIQLSMKPIRKQTVRVLYPDHSPAKGIPVVLFPKLSGRGQASGRLPATGLGSTFPTPQEAQQIVGEGGQILTTDQEGRIHVLDDAPVIIEMPVGSNREEAANAYFAVVATPQGVLTQELSNSKKEQTLQLRVWATIQGTLSQATKPLANRAVLLVSAYGSSEGPAADVRSVTLTDDKGRFQFDHVVPGTRYLLPTVDKGDDKWMAGRAQKIEVSPGTNTEAKLVLSGYRVRGSLSVTNGVSPGMEFRVGLTPLDPRSEFSAGVGAFNGSGSTIRGYSLPGSHLSVLEAIKAGGTFELVDVPPGKYTLRCEARQRPGGPSGFDPMQMQNKVYTAEVVVDATGLSVGDLVDLGQIQPVLKKMEDRFPGFMNR